MAFFQLLGHLSLAVVLFAGALVPATRAAAQICEGDCNGNRSVAINELILAVRIALGDAALGDCTAIDGDGSGTVAINELVAAVTRALQGCTGQIDTETLVASARAATEPIIRIVDLGRAAAGTGGAGAVAAQAVGGPAGSGCFTRDCVLGGFVTGSDDVCCFGNEFSHTWTDCIEDDELGNVFRRAGFFSIASDEVDVCTGIFPVGASFQSEFDGFIFEAVDTSSNFTILLANMTESFTAQPSGCSLSQPDEFGFGIRGDGVRMLDGLQHIIVGDASGTVVADTRSSSSQLRIVSASAIIDDQCAVAAQIDGGLESSDFIAGTEFGAEFSAFTVTEQPQASDLFLTLDGTVASDCLGNITLTTLDPLKLDRDGECLDVGRLRTEVDGATAAITFKAGGGLDIDVGEDGSVDAQFASCTDVTSADQCLVTSVPSLCDVCGGDQDCQGELACFPCTTNCQGSDFRCSYTSDFAACSDGVY